MASLALSGCSDDTADGVGSGGHGGSGGSDMGSGGSDVGSGGTDDGPIACTTVYVYGITATVIGGASAPSNMGGSTGMGGGSGDGCAAEVVAVDGDYDEPLECYVDGADCSCQGAGERAGTYTVTATLGSQTESQEVTVTGGECHVDPENVTFFE